MLRSVHNRKRQIGHGADVQPHVLAHRHRNQSAGSDHQRRAIARCNLGQCFADAGFELFKGFGDIHDLAVLPGGKDPRQVGGELDLLGRDRNALFVAQGGGQVEIFQLVQARVADGGQAGVHRVSRLDMSPQGTGIEPHVMLPRIAHMRAQPCGLLKAQRREAVV